MIDLRLANSFLLVLFFAYLYVAGFSYASFIVDSTDNAYLSTIIRVVLIFSMVFIRSLIGRFSKVDVFIYIFCAVLLATLNPFLSIVAFMVIVGLIFSDFVDSKYIVNIANCISMLCFLTILVLCFLGLSENYTFLDVNDYAKSIRYSLGFHNPNAASIFVVQSVILFFVYNNNIGKFFSIIISLFTIYYAASRTALFVGVLFVFLTLFVRSLFIVKVMKLLAVFSLMLIPFLLVVFVSNGIWSFSGIDLNQLLSGRLFLVQEFYNMIGGVSLLPSYVDYPLDSGFANILLKGGLIFYLIFFVFCCVYLKLESNVKFIFLFFSFLVLLLSENFITGNLLLSVVIMARFISLLKSDLVKSKAMVK